MDETEKKIYEAAKKLPNESGDSSQFKKMTRCYQGGNNRSYKIETESNIYFLKHFFSSVDDSWDRFETEIGFLKFARSMGLYCTPRLLAHDREKKMILFPFIDGERPATANSNCINQSLVFVESLNKKKNRQRGSMLPEASEAGFSLAEHIAAVEKRLVRLAEIKPAIAVDDLAVGFVKTKMVPIWNILKNKIKKQSSMMKMQLSYRLGFDETIISPSDFGFHNSIVNGDRLVFFDFEYAGWDDPAKMICDFFCQPEIPVPIKYYPEFCSRICCIMEKNGKKGWLQERTNILLPVTRMKWCCIMLNAFLPEVMSRKRFAMADEKFKQKQLEKTKKYFENFDFDCWN